MTTRSLAIAASAAFILFTGVACASDTDTTTASETPAAADPAPTESEVTEPTTEPVAAQPVATESVATEPVPTEPPDEVVIETAAQLDLDLIECDQFAMMTPITSDAARQLVPDDTELFLRDDGMPSLTHVSKTCSDIVVDGTSLGGGHFDTQWIRIVGPTEFREVPEHPDRTILETDYFHPVSFVTDNEAYYEAVAAFGVPMQLADSMEMAPIAEGDWTGRTVVGDAGYEWVVHNVNAVDMSIYFVHVLDRTDHAMQYRYDITCPADVEWFGGDAELTLFGGSELEAAVGSELVGRGGALRLTCDVAIDRTPGAG